ncbi:hydrolase [Priestia megaterium]|nr:hydrolase [Priestia megaterium]
MLRKFIILFCIAVLIQSHGSIALAVESVDFVLEENEAAITFLQLPDGEATLLQDGTDQTILINTGSNHSQKHLLKWLALYEIKKIDQLIITKQGKEYDENLQFVADKYNVEEIIVPIGYRGSHDSSLKEWKEKDIYQISKNIHVSVLHNQAQPSASMDLLLSFGQHQILYMANGTEHVEEKFHRKPVTKIDIIKLADFGMGEPLSEAFLNQINPQIAILFMKEKRKVSTELFHRLADSWIDLYDVDKGYSFSIKMSLKKYDTMKFSIE